MDDYKNSKEGRIIRQKYAAILQMERPEPSAKHPRMSLGSRAKIFSPFAAMRGFDDELAEEGAQTLRVPKAELSDEEKAALSAKLATLRRGMAVTVGDFVPDPLCPGRPPGGRYPTAARTVPTPGPRPKALRPAPGRPPTGAGGGEAGARP